MQVIHLFRGAFKDLGLTFWAFVLIATAGVVAHFDETPTATSETFLSRTDSLLISSDLARDQVKRLTDVTLQYEISWAQLIAAREDLRMQTRSFYAVIFVGLFSAALITQPKRRSIGNAILIVAILMYAVDVHTLDIIKRQEPNSIKLRNTLLQLLSVPSESTSWYTIDLQTSPTQSDGSWFGRFTKVTLPRLRRKFTSGLTPSFEQIGFYFVPILLLAATRRKLGI